MRASIKVTGKVQPKSETRKIVSESIQDLSRKELAQRAKQLFSTVNKRINRLKNSDVVSPALDALQNKREAHFTIGGKDLKALQREYAEALSFYNLETGTVKGARAFTKSLENMLGERVHDKNYLRKTFELLHTVQNRLPQIYKDRYGTDPIELQIIIERYTDLEESLYSNNAIEREQAIIQLIDKLTNDLTDQLHTTLEDIINSAVNDLGSGDLF